MGLVEYRVTWRRGDWSPNTSSKTRTFARRSDYERFVDRLRNHAEVGLAPAEIRTARRTVSAWQEDPR